METLVASLRGAGLSASLIVAIGAQNAYVLRKGIERTHVLPVVLVCTTCDALLISAGVAGAGSVVARAPALLELMRWLGAAYLLHFAWGAFARARRPSALAAASCERRTQTLRSVLATTLGLTLLNPHVYLDTVVLLGAVAAREPAALRPAFALGAMSVSCIWFAALGYGARLLTPFFAQPTAWRVLDASVAAMSCSIALSLLCR
jgi:L-lysine exporter family protein LysE/ArgO